MTIKLTRVKYDELTEITQTSPNVLQIAEVAGTSVETPAAGIYGLFVDSVDGQIKMVDSVGTITSLYYATAKDTEYTKIVGVIGTDLGASHATLEAAILAASAGDKILVKTDQTITTTININISDIQIDFMPNTSLTDSGAGTCFNITASDVLLKKPRFVGFTTQAVLIDAAANRTILDVPRFNTCTANITDNGNQTYINVEYTE